jgi:hypothetical protein
MNATKPVTLKRKREEEQPVHHTVNKRVGAESHEQQAGSTLIPSAKPGESSKSKQKPKEKTKKSEDSKPISEKPSHERKKTDQKSQTKRTSTKIPFKPRPKIVKLAPHRPYPTVPTSSSATGPKSKRAEGNNKICVTRRTNLGTYLSQCKNLFIKGGYVIIKVSITCRASD